MPLSALNGTETIAARKTPTSDVRIMSGSHRPINSSTGAVMFSPMLVPTITWPTRRPANGAKTGTLIMAETAVTSSGPRIQASGICAHWAANPPSTASANAPIAEIGGSRTPPGIIICLGLALWMRGSVRLDFQKLDETVGR